MPFALVLALSLLLAPAADPAGPIVYVEFAVEDGQGVAVRNLKAEEVRVLQDGAPEVALTFEPRPRPGHYAITYSPASGRIGPVSVRILRGGATVRGPDGPALRPRVIAAATPLERELAALLDAGPGTGTLAFTPAVLTFDADADGLHHTLAVEVPLRDVAFAPISDGFRGRVQVLIRVRDGSGHVRYRSAAEREVEVGVPELGKVKRLLSTADLHLGPGPYTFEALVRDPATGRLGARSLAFTAPATPDGPRLSSVVLLRGVDVMVARDPGGVGHDPLFYKELPLLPALETVVLPAATETGVQFFVSVYPDRAAAFPVAVELEVRRDDAPIGRVPVALPAPDPDGVIRYVGTVPTRTFRPADYVLRLVARQGSASATADAPFTIVPEGVSPVRVTPR